MTTIRNERGGIIIDVTEIRTVRDYYEKLYTNKLDNMEQTNKSKEKNTTY